MSLELKERLFPFDGEDNEYILYLESKLLQTQGITLTGSQTPSLAHSSDSSSDSDISELMDKRQFIYCSLSKNPSRTSIRKRQFSPSKTAYLGCGNQRQIVSRLPQWRKEMNRLTQSIPSLDMWDARRVSCGFPNPSSNHLALRHMLGLSVGVSSPKDNAAIKIPPLMPLDNLDMVIRGCKYGQLAQGCISSERFAILVGRFQKLIFISYCIVLLASGTSKSTVNWMMGQHISDSDPKNLERYRLGGLWVNRCVSILLNQGWGYKSWEIFVLCAQSLHQYGRFSDNSTSITVFTKAMGKANVPIFEDKWIPYCIPCIIKCLAGDSIGYKLRLVVSPLMSADNLLNLGFHRSVNV